MTATFADARDPVRVVPRAMRAITQRGARVLRISRTTADADRVAVAEVARMITVKLWPELRDFC